MQASLPKRVTLIEVGARDGLQNEQAPITTEVRIELCDRLTDAGFPNVEAVLKVVPADKLSGHFHDTYGMALANVYASLEMGIATYHASVAGLGGCPYAKGATGNVATEDLLYLLDGLGIETGVSLPKMVEIGQWISGHIGRKSISRAGNAIAAKQAG